MPKLRYASGVKKADQKKIQDFQKTIWDYYAKNKRQMPWRETTDPYRILVSEVMLQQTQVSRVIPKYESFIKKFPDFATLARASVSDVLKLWQGLGYNRRALSLKRAAEMVVKEYGGVIPCDAEKMIALPGIGNATAGAILAYAFQQPSIFIETNIRRVFIHFFFPRSKKVSDQKIISLVNAAVDRKKPREWYYALMDYGAYLKTQITNPNRRSAHYSKQSRFKGSNREVRGAILRILVKEGSMKRNILLQKIGDTEMRGEINIDALAKEGFIDVKRHIVSLV